ncbi:ABC transporter permease subunit [Psychromonas antarctica]|uniref:ABC transporter permease subunit n=1 Tax=Psychromonas antarctica TaxID=67573 RepID=UPI001EE94CEB|nr:ABC transporter permease subunit [Psychromonas antarctica]MCG6200451.1 ABC transporter permease subunit [Psychromonas antarctica]
MDRDFANKLKANRKRLIKDKLVKYSITTGGSLVLVTLLLIFGYLLYVVLPIFAPVSIKEEKEFSYQTDSNVLALALDEQNDVAYKISDDGKISFYSLRSRDLGDLLLEDTMLSEHTAFAQSVAAGHAYLFADAQGQVKIFQADFITTYPDDARLITPNIRYPFGSEKLTIDDQGHAITAASFQFSDSKAAIAVVTDDKRGIFLVLNATQNMMTDEIEWEEQRISLPALPNQVDQILLSPDMKNLFVLSHNDLLVYDVSDTDNIHIKSALPINALDADVTDIQLLTGASSLMVANTNGVISQWFEVLKDNKRTFTFIRDFKAEGKIRTIIPEYFRKVFFTADNKGYLSVFHSTGHTRLLSEKVSDNESMQVAISPRANALLIAENTRLRLFSIDNEHPDITWSTLWQKVWYEGYPKAEYLWQSTSASDSFEAKMSLVPLSFGTIKAAFYAMLFAVPIAISAAIYTGYFMSPSIRSYIKPTVEIMEALPTVILGFLAGLWLAPLIENQLPGIILLLVSLPLSVLAAALAWSTLPKKFKEAIPEGYHPLILIPVLLLVGYGSMSFSGTLELWLFDGNARMYLTNELGINFDQRNSLVVGIAMGFAVIPTIFSIAEDAIFSVPKSLTMGSLALGATPWQTLAKVVILTASPGMFSAIMMGTGRAVGETMIVLMATGNTPIMDWNIFEGMRTLSANIAVEIPESAVGSSHYRVLFLAAFVLFIFTFFFNTVAEFIRQRLREKYSSL